MNMAETKQEQAKPEEKTAVVNEQVLGGEPLTDVEVTLDVEPDAKEPEKPAAQEAVKPEKPDEDELEVREEDPNKRGPSRTRTRINKLVVERNTERERSVVAEARLQKAAQAIQYLQGELQRANQTGFVHWERAEKANLTTATSKYEEAMTASDHKKAAEATAEIARAQAELASIEAWKRGPQAQRQAQNSPGQQQNIQQDQRATAQQPNQAVEHTQESLAWMKANDWYDRQSPNHDREMQTEALAFAAVLDRKFRRQGKEDKLLGADYFKEIDAHMKAEFPEAFEDEPTATRRSPAMQGNGIVAPSSASSGTGSDAIRRSGRQISVKLTADEREVARNMTLKHANGTPFSPAEKEREYALYKAGIKKGVEVSVRSKVQ